MEKLISAADKLLSLLPFDGNKTLIGAGLKLALPVAVAKFPVVLLVAPAIDAFADFCIAAGLAHKAVKVAKKDK